jgi:hypothetical protein
VGCAEELPDERMIENTRILAMRVEVTAPLFPDEPDSATRCQALPFETVRIEPWIVDPDGPVDLDELDPVWIACQMTPGQGLFGCISNEFPTDLDDIPECEVPDFMDLETGELPEAQGLCLIGRDPRPEFTVPMNSSILIGGEIEVTMIAGPPGGTSTETCAKKLLSGDHEVPDDCILALQRLEIGPLEQLLIFADQLGIDLGFPPPDPDDVPDFDRNPRVTRFEVAILDEDGEPGELVAVERGGSIEAKIGDTLRVETTVPQEDLQSFLQQLNETETEQDEETLDGDYYRTFGSFLNGSVDDPEAYDEWTLEREAADEPERPEDDRATLFLTMRDSRTGVDWWWFHVDIVDDE